MTLLGDIPAHDDRAASGPKGAIAATPRWFASHELRTPMQAIQGSVEVLLEDGGRGLSSLQLEAVSLIADAAQALERCVGHLAELADLAQRPPAPLDIVALDAFLASPEIASHVSVGCELAEAAAGAVLVAPATAGRALAALAQGSADHEPACRLAVELTAIHAGRVTLAVELARAPSGDGAVARRLAVMLLEHSGIAFEQQSDGRARLTLQRADHTPI